ncbi:hypothetical protein MUK42_10775 [Musa troglodytarum]|uniref:DUF295 domain-containing protein n=1 Tax=Musa troglodytarum TaxID=320322 RepID=A0A9E7JDK2_9LILI|nr:hypothetical protein MUK42_10775 [Musa troglodytarum]
MGDHCLFIDCAGKCPVSGVHPSSWGGRSNCVYVAAPGYDAWVEYSLDDKTWSQSSVSSGHTISGRQLPPVVGAQSGELRWPSPVWVYPSIFCAEMYQSSVAIQCKDAAQAHQQQLNERSRDGNAESGYSAEEALLSVCWSCPRDVFLPHPHLPLTMAVHNHFPAVPFLLSPRSSLFLYPKHATMVRRSPPSTAPPISLALLPTHLLRRRFSTLIKNRSVSPALPVVISILNPDYDENGVEDQSGIAPDSVLFRWGGSCKRRQYLTYPPLSLSDS